MSVCAWVNACVWASMSVSVHVRVHVRECVRACACLETMEKENRLHFFSVNDRQSNLQTLFEEKRK